MVTTSLIQLNIACADHKNGVPLSPCAACEFIAEYKLKMYRIRDDIDSLTGKLEELMKAGKITAIDFNRRFLKGHL